ncbi:hypothetical protein R4144_22200 [Gordonia amicalis]|uniref:hypothetical protein n=1 Tax=Gordonia amicalis TaxID=89053 RepID=UPI002954612C|nr:hypothetical protein [Gordonia amicalis]MDV7176011.1 hypothetical protein [Gordonia amicalis]
MATIESYSTKSGTRYRVRYRTPEGRQTDKRGFKRKADAQAFRATVEVEMLRGEYVAPALGRITVAELANEWLRRKQSAMKPSSYRVTETSWRVHVEPRWGSVRLNDIDLDAVERWIADMGRTTTDLDGSVVRRGSGATVVLRAYGILAGILDSGVKARRLSSNPARTPDNLPRKRQKKHTYLTHAQVAALAAASKYPTLVVLTRDVRYGARRVGVT